MSDEQDQLWSEGYKAAYSRILAECLRHLGCDDPEAGKARWLLERTAVVACLRSACRDYGDNDWDDDLHLVDVIEKHLLRHIEGPW